jgi:hypothetical protein
VYDEEREYLEKLHNGSISCETGGVDSPLINAFDPRNPIILSKETEVEEAIPKLLEQRRITTFGENERAIVDYDEFMARWRTLTHGALEGFDWVKHGVFACGGAVLGCLLTNNVGFHHADVDLFLCVDTTDAAQEALRAIVETITRNTAKITDKPVETFRTKRSISVRTGYRTYQIVTTLYRNLEDVLFAFDVDACCVGFRGNGVATTTTNTTTNNNEGCAWVTPRAKRAITKRYNLVYLAVRHALALPGRYERRLFKYARRGFAVAVPGFDRSAVDPTVWLKYSGDVMGLSKLLLLDKAVSDHPNLGDPKHFFVTDIDNCIHGGGSWCRVCHMDHSLFSPGSASDGTPHPHPHPHPHPRPYPQTLHDGALHPITPEVEVHAQVSSVVKAPHEPPTFKPQLPAPTLFSSTRLMNGTAPLTWEKRHVVLQDLEVDKTEGTTYYTRNLEYVHPHWDDGVYGDAGDGGHVASSSSGDVLTHQQDHQQDHHHHHHPPRLSAVHGYQAVMCDCALPAALRTVRKETVNKGRRFFGCSQLPPACRFFCWAETLAVPATATTTPAPSPSQPLIPVPEPAPTATAPLIDVSSASQCLARGNTTTHQPPLPLPMSPEEEQARGERRGLLFLLRELERSNLITPFEKVALHDMIISTDPMRRAALQHALKVVADSIATAPDAETEAEAEAEGDDNDPATNSSSSSSESSHLPALAAYWRVVLSQCT